MVIDRNAFVSTDTSFSDMMSPILKDLEKRVGKRVNIETGNNIMTKAIMFYTDEKYVSYSMMMWKDKGFSAMVDDAVEKLK